VKGSPINLNRVRKIRARAMAKSKADGNAFKFGRSKAEKLRSDLEAKRATNHLEGHKKGDT